MLNKKTVASTLVLATLAIPTITQANNTNSINSINSLNTVNNITEDFKFDIKELKKEFKGELKVIKDNVKDNEELKKEIEELSKKIEGVKTEEDLNKLFDEASDIYSKVFEHDFENGNCFELDKEGVTQTIKDTISWLEEESKNDKKLQESLKKVKELLNDKDLENNSEKVYDKLLKLEDEINKHLDEKYQNEYFNQSKEDFPKWIDEDINWLTEEAKKEKVNVSKEIKELRELKEKIKNIKDDSDLSNLFNKQSEIINSATLKIYKIDENDTEFFGYEIPTELDNFDMEGLEKINDDLMNGLNSIIK